VFEDNVEQEVVTFSGEDVHFDRVILI